MINLDSITNEKNKKHNQILPYIPDHPYRILIIGDSGSGKTKALINLINEQKDINKIYLNVKDLSEPNYEYLIKKPEDGGIKHVNNSNAFMSVQILWMIFTKIFMITIQTEEEQFKLFLTT